MTRTVTQTQFLSAALDPERDVPNGIVGPDGAPAPKRFSVYRNNIIVSLKEAMSSGFPAVESLVGEAFFAAMCDGFIRQNPPQTPVMVLYGDRFAAFIAQFPPAQSLPYLADVAHLEYALRRSYHAADAAPVAPEALQDPRIFSARLKLAPTVLTLRSAYPVTQIREAALGGPPPTGGPEDVLITRPALDPIATGFPSGTADIIAALERGLALGDAVEAAPDGLDLTAFIGALVQGGAIVATEMDHV